MKVDFSNIIKIINQYDTFILISIFFLAWHFISKTIVSYVDKTSKNVEKKYKVRKSLSKFTITILIILISFLATRYTASLATFLGLLSAGIAIALQDIIADIAGWIFILVRRPFEIQDRVQIGDFIGDVIDIRPFEFTILEIGNRVNSEQSTGRIIHVPNNRVLREEVANYSKGFKYIWNEIPILITFESDWELAKEVLENIVNKNAIKFSEDVERNILDACKRYMIHYDNLEPTVYTSIKDSGVLLTIRYLSKPRQRRETEQIIYESILKEFKKIHTIELAYPTTRLYRKNKKTTIVN